VCADVHGSAGERDLSLLDMESELCERTMRAHKVAATKIRSKDDRFEKHTDFFFPDGIKCSFEHFNVAAKLKARYRILEVPISNDTGSKLPLKQLVSFHMWKLIIIGEVKQLEKLEISSDENLTEAHNRMAFIYPLIVEILAGYNNWLDTSSTDETLRPFSSINNHGNEDGIPNDSGLQHLESSMLNPDKQKENDKHGQGGKSQHEVIENGASISTYSFNPAALEHYVPIQNTKNKRKRNEEKMMVTA